MQYFEDSVIRISSGNGRVGSRLLAPRSYNNEQQDENPDVFTSIAQYFVSEGIKTVVGPVLSGAQIAYAIAVHARGRLRINYTKKAGYSPRVHGETYYLEQPWAFVDDIIGTGNAYKECVQELCKQLTLAQVLTDSICLIPPRIALCTNSKLINSSKWVDLHKQIFPDFLESLPQLCCLHVV